MLTVVLGLLGAVSYGAADFLGGLTAKRLRPVVVAAVAAAVGILPPVIGLAVVPSVFSADAFRGGLAAGVCAALGILLLYSLLAIGPMSVLSPLTAVVAAVVPVIVGVVRGVALSPLAIVALVVAVIAVVLVAAVRSEPGSRLTWRGIVIAVLAGSALGGLVLAYDTTPADSGVAPVVIARLLQTVLLGVGALVVAAVARSRTGGVPRRPRWDAKLVVGLIGCGLLDSGANVLIQAGLHSSTDPTTLPVMSVLSALYPVGTILLAGLVLRERLSRMQGVGIALAIATSIGLALA